MLIRFFTRKDFGGWRKFMWLPVTLMQGKYVHCEIQVGGSVFNADNRNGIEETPPKAFKPSSVISVTHSSIKYIEEKEKMLGQSYSWSAFFRLLLPKWGSDPKGMICSELVAHMIANCAKDEKFRIPFIATPSHRWTPNAVHSALTRLMAQ